MSIVEQNKQSRRIAKNSLLLFVRMFVLMLINLYAVRVLQSRLGIVDFGVFHVVAGVITMLTCVSSVMAVSTQRFYSYAQGKGEYNTLRRIFSVSVNVNIMFSVLFILLFETLGVWFLNTKLDIPSDRIVAANWVFQFALFSFVCTLCQIPFTAAFIAHEDMGTYALITTAECVLKLAVALLIGIVAIDNLQFYSAGLLVVSLFVFGTYLFVAGRRYTECSYELVTESAYYKRLVSFSGWTFLGSIANVGLIQGNAILINLFFGPLVNAAFAVSVNVYNAFMSLCNNVVLAIRPAMVRAFAERNHAYLNRLFYVSNKAIALLTLMIAMPLLYEMDFILKVWLGDYAEHTAIFSRLVIVYVAVIALNNPITIIMQASGNLKTYHLSVESVTLLSIPIAYVLFTVYGKAEMVYISMIILAMSAHVVRLVCLRRQMNFSCRRYISAFLMPVTFVIAIMMALGYAVYGLLGNGFLGLVVLVAVSVLILPLIAYVLVLDHDERLAVKAFVTNIKQRII